MYSHIFFFFNDTATTEIYTLSLHDALPISEREQRHQTQHQQVGERVLPEPGLELAHEPAGPGAQRVAKGSPGCQVRSEEHTSELQSRQYLVCRLLLEKKKNTI